MNKLKLLIRFFLLILVVMGVYVISQRADIITGTIAKRLGVNYKAVAGARTGPNNDEIAKTVENTLEIAKKQLFNIKIGDMVGAVGNAAKLGSQLNAQKDAVIKQIQPNK